jgi:ribosomal protein S18
MQVSRSFDSGVFSQQILRNLCRMKNFPCLDYSKTRTLNRFATEEKIIFRCNNLAASDTRLLSAVAS